VSAIWLDEDELFLLTGYRQRFRQRAALAELRIPFRSRPADGFPLVERSQFDGGIVPRKRNEPKYPEAK